MRILKRILDKGLSWVISYPKSLFVYYLLFYDINCFVLLAGCIGLLWSFFGTWLGSIVANVVLLCFGNKLRNI